MEELVTFRRRFQVWSYTVSHKQLLLRSTKSAGVSTRIDVLFKNVMGIHLPTLVDEVTIAVLDKEEVPVAIRLGAHHLTSTNVYTVQGPNYDGYVIAGSVTWVEDSLEFDDPSGLVQLPGDAR